MARQFVVLALVFFAVVGMASASADAPAPLSEVVAQGPSADNTIGTIDGNTDAAPVGSPVPDSAFPNVDAPVPAPSGASALQISAIAGVAATALSALYF